MTTASNSVHAGLDACCVEQKKTFQLITYGLLSIDFFSPFHLVKHSKSPLFFIFHMMSIRKIIE